MPLFCVTFKHHYLQHKLLQMGCTDVALRKHSTDGTRLGCDIFYEQWENPLRAIICFATQWHSRADSTAVSRIPSSGMHPCYWDVKWRASSVLYRQCFHKNIYPLYLSIICFYREIPHASEFWKEIQIVLGCLPYCVFQNRRYFSIVFSSSTLKCLL